MAIGYHVYGNGGGGGPVDYATPLATVATLTWSSPPLAAGASWTFAVRAYDTASGLEESNVDARASLALDAALVDVTGRPNAPTGLAARPAAGGSIVATWGYNPGGQGGAPQGFRVYAGTPTVSYAAAVAVVPYNADARAFSATIEGLTGGNATYQISVRAFNAAGEETNATVASATAVTTGPLPVESLTATVVA